MNIKLYQQLIVIYKIIYSSYIVKKFIDNLLLNLWMFLEVSTGLVLAFTGLSLCAGYPQSWSCLWLAGVVLRIPPVFVLPLMGCGCVQACPCISFVFTGLWLYWGFPGSWCCLFWAVLTDTQFLTLGKGEPPGEVTDCGAPLIHQGLLLPLLLECAKFQLLKGLYTKK